MSKKFLLTAFSKDRPGIVADITKVIFDNDYNLEESSMTYLAGEFAILILLAAPSAVGEEEVMENLSTECRRLEREKNITAYIRPVNDEIVPPKAEAVVKTILVEGVDQAGIVYKVSKFLADSNINIRTLESEVRLSPQSGSALYVMAIEVEIPRNISLQVVEDGLGIIADQLNVDVTIE